MPKPKYYRTRVKLSPPALDHDEFNKLTDILFETFKENHNACAKILGVNWRTWRKWEREPPEWPYWNLVLRYVLRNALASMRGHRGITEKHRVRLLNALSALGKDDPLAEEIEDMAYQSTGAAAHLRRILAKRGMYWDQIRLPANSGAYSERRLRQAARMIGVVKTQKGFGDSKRSFWRLPELEDEYD